MIPCKQPSKKLVRNSSVNKQRLSDKCDSTAVCEETSSSEYEHRQPELQEEVKSFQQPETEAKISLKPMLISHLRLSEDSRSIASDSSDRLYIAEDTIETPSSESADDVSFNYDAYL